MIALAFLVILLGAQLIAVTFAIVSSARARFPVGIALAILALAAMPLRFVPFAQSATLAGAATLVAGVVVVGIAWRRRATLSPNDPAVAQGDRVVGSFLALAILGAVELVGPLLAALVDVP